MTRQRCSCKHLPLCQRYEGKWYRVTCWHCGRKALRASRSIESAERLWDEEREKERER